MTERSISPFHDVGVIPFKDRRLDVSCWYDDDHAQWLIDLTAWKHRVNPHLPPESCYTMAPTEARQLAALILKAAEAAELFHAGDLFREGLEDW